jgi:hypothetical protein
MAQMHTTQPEDASPLCTKPTASPRGDRPAFCRRKTYCYSIPAITGPWRAKMRAWHGHDMRAATAVVFGHTASGQPPWHTLISGTCEDAHTSIPRLRMALRRERQLGRGGSQTYSLERHAALARALKVALARGKVQLSIDADFANPDFRFPGPTAPGAAPRGGGLC